MDWLTFKFCVLIWVLCVSISKSQSQLLNSTSSISSQLRSDCEDGQPVVPPDQCNSCICFAGQIYCTNIPCPEQDCISGVDLPQPDACNKCICRRGKVTCSNMICIPAPHCAEKQLYPAQNKCNACMCLNGFITCTSNPCAEEPLPSTIPTTTTKKPKKKKKCIEGSPLPGSDECMECFCQDGRKRCKFICNPIVESRFGEGPECVSGQHIPRPDDCNNCICFEGQIHCTHLPCRMDIRIGPECSDDQPVYRPDECNECYCFEGRLECSDLVCIRGSKCVQGQVIPKPDSCNACKCVEGHILCTDYQCPVPNSRNALRPARSSTEVGTLDECQEGDIISPPPPPNDCNTCYCMDNRILCTKINCEGSYPEIKGRLRDPNEQTDLEIFDKKISVDPFIDMLSKNHEKLPAKLIHTHAYNGFHQEIKVHASHLPKDATKLLKVLATSLNNSALASISQRLLSSSNSLPNNHDLKLPLDHQVAQINISGKGSVLTTQSSKFITSGSQSNETILVIPNTDDVEYSQSVLPLTSKHESIWKSVSSPASLVFHNNQQLNPHSSQEEKLNVNYFDNPPSIFTPIDQNNVIRNPSKFSRPGLAHMLPTKPTRNTVEKTNTNGQSIYPSSNPNNVNVGKMSYAPFSQDNKQLKPIPSGFVSKHDKLPHLRPYQPTLPGPTQVFNYTSSTPIFRPGKFIVITNNNDGQQKPSQSHFIPNLSKYYANQVKPQQSQFKPNQNHLPTLNNMGIQHSPLFPNNLNQVIVAANQYKQPQFGLKPGQGSVNSLNNIGNQTDQQFKAFPPIFQINPPLIHIPNHKKRISSINDGSKEVLPHFMAPNSTAHHDNILNPSQIGVDPKYTHHKPSHSQLVPNPSIIYRNEDEVPKIIEVNPDQEQLIPHSKISYKDPEHYNPPHKSSELDHDTLVPKARNKTRKYNTTHSHYEKHTSVTYVSEYDPTHPANPEKIVHDLNQHQNAPQINVNDYYLPDQESQELDLTMSKVNYYLNLPSLQVDQNVEPHPKLTYSSQTTVFPDQQQNYPLNVHPTMSEMNKYNQHDSWNITNHQFDTYPHSPSDGEHPAQIKSYENRTNPAIPMFPNIFVNYPHSSSQSQFIPSQDNYKKEGWISTQSLSNSDKEPTHPKSIEDLPSPSQTRPSQNQHPPGVIDDWGSTNGFQYAHNAYEDPRQLKPVDKLFPSKLETPQHHQLPGFLDERGSADGFQYPSLSAEDLTQPKVEHNKSPHFDPYKPISNFEQPKDNPFISPHSQLEPAQNQYKPRLFDNRGDKDEFQYAHNADRNPTHVKPMHKLLPFSHSHTPFSPNLNQHSPGTFDERASADGFQYPSTSTESPIQSRGNIHNPKLSQFGPTQNQHLPGIFTERGSAEGFQYPPNSAEKPLHPKEIVHKPPNSPFVSTAHKQLPGMFDERGSTDGFQYPSNSAEQPLHPKVNMHQPPNSPFGSFTNKQLPEIYPSDSAGSPARPKNTNPEKYKQNQPRSQVGPNHNKLIPGTFDGLGSPDDYQYSANSPQNSLNQKDGLHYPSHSQFGSPQNQYLPGVVPNHVSPGGFQYPSNSAKNRTNSKDNLHILPHSQFVPNQNQHEQILQSKQPNSPIGPTQKQNLPGMFDERGSANGFQYPSHSAENSLQPKDNQHNPPHHQFGPAQNQHIPGVFDDRGSADGFQYTSNSAENPGHPEQIKQIQPKSPIDSTQNQPLPGMYDERGSTDGFQYPSNAPENPTHPKDNLHKHQQSQIVPSHNQHTPGVFNDRGSTDSFQYPSNSADNSTHPHNNLHKHPQSQFLPSPNQHTPGVFDDRGSFDGFQYPFNLAENPRYPKQNKQIQPNSPFDTTQNQHLPSMFDERGSANSFEYPSNSVENPIHPKDNLHKLPQSQFLPSPNQHTPGVLDDRGSTDGFQYSSNSAENARHPKQINHIQPKSPIDPTKNQHLPGMFDERGSADGFQYPSNSVENPTHPEDNLHKLPQSQFLPSTNQNTPGVFDDRGFANGFQYPSNSVENPTHSKDNLHKLPQSQFLPSTNQNTPGVFDDRGSSDGFQYPSNSVENPIHPKGNLHKLPQSQLLPSPNQHTPGVFDVRGSTDGFQYPSNSAENARHPKQNNHIQPKSPIDPTQNQHLPGMFDERGSADGFQYPPNSVENPTHPKDNLHKLPQSQFLPSPNQHTPGVFNDRGSTDGFQYPSNSAENARHPKQNNHIQPKSPIDPTQNQHLPGMFDERGSADGFQYPSNSAENHTHPKDNLHKLSQSQFLPYTNQNTPGVFDDRGSANGFEYPSNSVENPIHPKDNLHKLPQSQFLPSPNQYTPGVFDDRGSTDGFQYPSNSAENARHPKQINHIQPKSSIEPTQNQHLPGTFDERGSADGFQYPSNSAENPTHPKDNLHKLPQSQFLPSTNQNTPGVFDDRGSTNGFEYPSNSVENPTHPKDNLHKLPQSQFLPSPNQHTPGVFDDRGSTDGFQYPSNSAENARHPKQINHIQPKSPIDPTKNQHLPGMFDERGSADGFQYPSNSVENPTHPKDNLHKLPQSQFLPSPNQNTPGIFDDRGSANGFQYPSNSAENARHSKQNNHIQPNSPIHPTQNQHLPGMFDNRGSSDGLQHPSNSVENPRHPKDILHKHPQSQFLPSPNQHTPGVFSDRGSADGFHYPSNSAEDSTHPKGKPPHSLLGPTQNQHLPGMFDERGSADGFQYPSNSAENSTHSKNKPNTTPESKFKLPQNQPKPSSLDDSYNNNNPLGPWMHLDHDQYKPSSFNNLPTGVHNIPWSFSGNQNKDSDPVTNAPNPRLKPDFDQYIPSSFDKLFNGIHQTPWSVPNQDYNALGFDAEITTSRSGFKPKQGQYEPSMVDDPSITNKNESTDFTDVDDNQLKIDQDVSTLSTDHTDSVSPQYNLLPKLKPDSDTGSLLPTDDGKIPDYYDQLYPLFKAVKKLSDPPIDDSVHSVGSMGQLDLLPFLFPGIAKMLDYKPSQDENDVSPVENLDAQRINPLSKVNSKLEQLPENDSGILNWLKSKFNKLVPTKHNATVTKNDIDITKIFNLLSKLTPPYLKHTTALHNVPFSGFDPEIIENIMNDFEEDTLTATSTPRTDFTHSNETRFSSDPTVPEESQPQAPQLKYPDVHIILHQPNDEDDVDVPSYIETDGEINLATDMDSEELSASMFPKMFNPRFRHRAKDQKEECGDGTQWISNCHGCSCYFGEAMCFILPDCELRPLGEPMTCKPYSHFKMGCYTCECNGDGVAECDATACNTQLSGKNKVSGSTEKPLPVFNEFIDSKKTKEISKYYNFTKKFPKDCPNEDLQTQYPTCERGTSWVSSCHKCECNDSGKHECIKIEDCELDVDSYGKPARCKPNSKFYPKTNSMPCVECSCNDEGKSYCPTADYKKH